MKPSAIFPLPGESLAEKKARRKAEHALQTTRLYIDAVQRSLQRHRGQGRLGAVFCELCHKAHRKLELHHIEGGIGRRRERQCLANVALACERCHGESKKNSSRYFELLAAFIAHYHYPEPACLRRRP